LFGLVLLYGLPLLPQNAAQTIDHRADSNRANNTLQKPTIDAQHSNKKETPPGKKDDDPPKRDYEMLGFYVNLILTIATLVIAITAAVQAIAAKISAEAVRNAERAWVTVSISKPSLEDMNIRAKPDNYGVGVGLTFKNLGKTPSKILGSYVRALMADSVDPDARPIFPNLPESPDYSLKLEHSIIAQPGIFWMPRQKFECLVFLPKMFFEKDLARWEISEKALCIYGFIEYVDVFNRKHNTRFCYVYAHIRASLPLQNQASGEMIFPPGFCLSGPEAYNLCD